MSKLAKDEADLVECMAKAMQDSVYRGQSKWEYTSKVERYYREAEAEAALAAIRAAGWAVVPARLTKDMEYDAIRAENARLREAIRVNALRWAPHLSHAEIDAIVAAASEVKP
jgi:hypothetical protein